MACTRTHARPLPGSRGWLRPGDGLLSALGCPSTVKEHPKILSRRRLWRRWPSVSAVLSLGRPAQRTPGRISQGTQIKVAQTNTGWHRQAVFLAPDSPSRGWRINAA